MHTSTAIPRLLSEVQWCLERPDHGPDHSRQFPLLTHRAWFQCPCRSPGHTLQLLPVTHHGHPQCLIQSAGHILLVPLLMHQSLALCLPPYQSLHIEHHPHLQPYQHYVGMIKCIFTVSLLKLHCQLTEVAVLVSDAASTEKDQMID